MFPIVASVRSIVCVRLGSNQGHLLYKSSALPLSYGRLSSFYIIPIVDSRGIEPLSLQCECSALPAKLRAQKQHNYYSKNDTVEAE